MEIKPLKHGSERAVHLPDDLLTMLAQHVETHTDKCAAERWLFKASRDIRRTRTQSATGDGSPPNARRDSAS